MNYPVLMVLNTALLTIYYIVNYTGVFESNGLFYLRGSEKVNVNILS